LPQYNFTVRPRGDDQFGARTALLQDDAAALNYAFQLIGELKNSDYYNEPGYLLQVRDDRRPTVFSIPFLPGCA